MNSYQVLDILRLYPCRRCAGLSFAAPPAARARDGLRRRWVRGPGFADLALRCWAPSWKAETLEEASPGGVWSKLEESGSRVPCYCKSLALAPVGHRVIATIDLEGHGTLCGVASKSTKQCMPSANMIKHVCNIVNILEQNQHKGCVCYIVSTDVGSKENDSERPNTLINRCRPSRIACWPPYAVIGR